MAACDGAKAKRAGLRLQGRYPYFGPSAAIAARLLPRASKDQSELRSQYLFIRPIATCGAAVEVCYFVVQLRFDVAVEIPVDTNAHRVRSARSSGRIGKRVGRTIKGGAIEMDGVV